MSDSKQIDYYNHNNFLFYCNRIWRLVAILNFKQNSESGNRNELSDLKASGKRFLYYYFPFSRAKEDIAPIFNMAAGGHFGFSKIWL